MESISSPRFSEYEVGVLAVVSGHIIHGDTVFKEYVGLVADEPLKPAPSIGILILHPCRKRVDTMSKGVCIRVMTKPEGKGKMSRVTRVEVQGCECVWCKG